MAKFASLKYCALVFIGTFCAYDFTIVKCVLGEDLEDSDSVIVGGFPINITDAPYQVSVQLGGSMVCGGAILSKFHVATAAHCIMRTTVYFSVRAGTTDHIEGGSIHNASKITIHPLYDDILYDYDIAIIEITPPFEFDEFRQRIEIAKEEVTGGDVIITGWGTLVEDGGTSRMLQGVIVPVVKFEECNDLYAEYGGLSPRMMCAGSAGHDSCQGDSGGPVVSNGTLVGTVSWANGCAREGYPGVNVNLLNYEIRDFIRNVTGV